MRTNKLYITRNIQQSGNSIQQNASQQARIHAFDKQHTSAINNYKINQHIQMCILLLTDFIFLFLKQLCRTIRHALQLSNDHLRDISTHLRNTTKKIVVNTKSVLYINQQSCATKIKVHPKANEARHIEKNLCINKSEVKQNAKHTFVKTKHWQLFTENTPNCKYSALLFYRNLWRIKNNISENAHNNKGTDISTANCIPKLSGNAFTAPNNKFEPLIFTDKHSRIRFFPEEATNN